MAALVAAAGEPAEPLSKTIFGEIACDGHVNYRSGVAPWLTQTEGMYPIVTPLQVKTFKSQCRITFAASVIFEAGPTTDVALSQSEGGPLTLTVNSGSALYAVPNDRPLKIVVPSVGTVALAGPSKRPERDDLPALQLPPADGLRIVPTSIRPMPGSPSVVHMGVIEVAAGPSVKFSNLKGNLAYLLMEDTFQPVAIGEPVTVSGDSPARAQLAAADDPAQGKKSPTTPSIAGAAPATAAAAPAESALKLSTPTKVGLWLVGISAVGAGCCIDWRDTKSPWKPYCVRVFDED